MRRPVRIFVAVIMTAVAAACGLDVLATGGVLDGDDAGLDASASDRNPPRLDGGDEGSEVELDGGIADADADAGPDEDAAYQKCVGVCEAGVCEGGTCNIDCVGNSACINDRIVCPPGVPCRVVCDGTSTCAGGVDCMSATACNIVCNGNSACINGTVACTGSACKVRCLGNSACSLGVTCDAGLCDLACVGASACINGVVDCRSDVCNVKCGDGGNDGANACVSGVQCRAKSLCNVDCATATSCRNGPVIAIAGDASTVHCVQNSCQSGVFVSATDAGVACEMGGACVGAPIHCDAGKCSASCNGSNPQFCCKAPAAQCVETEVSGCNLTQAGCPP